MCYLPVWLILCMLRSGWLWLMEKCLSINLMQCVQILCAWTPLPCTVILLHLTYMSLLNFHYLNGNQLLLQVMYTDDACVLDQEKWLSAVHLLFCECTDESFASTHSSSQQTPWWISVTTRGLWTAVGVAHREQNTRAHTHMCCSFQNYFSDLTQVQGDWWSSFKLSSDLHTQTRVYARAHIHTPKASFFFETDFSFINKHKTEKDLINFNYRHKNCWMSSFVFYFEDAVTM